MLLGQPERTPYDLNFVLLGVPVRVHPFFWLVALMLSGLGQPIMVFIWVVAIFISILAHEMGHALAARAHGWQPWITLYGLGGLASYQPTRRDPWSQIVISLAGPVAGFLLAGFIVSALFAAGHSVSFQFGSPLGIDLQVDGIDNDRLFYFVKNMLWINIAWGLVNLLPIFPLDGGQVSRELFNLYYPRDGVRTSLRLSMFVAAAVCVYGLSLSRQFSGRQQGLFIAILFGYLAYSSYAALQAYSGRGGGFRGGGW